MAVLFLDDNFDIVSPPKSDFFSMIWELNYYELGKFSLEAHPDYFPFAQTASYLYSNENDRTGKITGMEFNDQKSSVKISGLCIECLLEDRVITQKETLSLIHIFIERN